MTRIDPALLVALTSALQTPAHAEQKRRARPADDKTANARRPEGNRTGQLTQLLQQRVQQLKANGALSDEDVLTMAIQETLALEFGEDIAAHPRFRDVTEKIRSTLLSVPEFQQLLPTLASRVRE